jgi:hypothetical protein
LTVDRWLLDLADKNAPALRLDDRKRTILEVFAEACEILDGEELDLTRDPAPDKQVNFFE